MNRRQFIRTHTALLGGLAIGASTIPSLARRRRWGIILNTVRHDMEVDYRATLTELAAMGYRYLEGGVYGDDPVAYRRFVRRLGLRPVISGGSMGVLQQDLDEYIRTAHQLGQRFITCYWPWLSDARNLTETECLETADRLNVIGRRLHREGLGFTWHNHDKEFATIGDRTALDLLLERTDPAWVNLQMDLYWVHKAGADPVAIWERHPGRTQLLHLKDMTPVEGDIACVGAGRIDFVQLLNHPAMDHVRYATVEHERTQPGEGLTCVRTSIDYLQNHIR